MGLLDEALQVADPNQQASEETEAFLRGNPVTSPFASASDAADFYTGNANAPDASGGNIAIATGRQFDDVEGGGILDTDTLKGLDFGPAESVGKQFDNQPGGGFADQGIDAAQTAIDDTTDAVGNVIPWSKLLLVGVVLLVVNALAQGAGEGLTS